MNRRITGALLGAALPVALYAAPTAAADDDVQCGAPAIPAVYETVTHAAGSTTLPAETLLHWLWTRTVLVPELQYSLTAAGFRALEWARESGIIVGPGGEQTSSKESILLPRGAVPGGDGWQLTGSSFWLKTKNLEIWSLVPPLGTKWEATGKKRTVRQTETTTEHSLLPPPGEGWVKVPGSEITVSLPERTVHVDPVEEEILVSPSVPAGPPCATDEPTAAPVESATDRPTSRPAAPTRGATTDPTVLGVEQVLAPAPVAVPTAVDAGLGASTDGSSSPWLAALTVFGAVAAGFGVAGARRPARKH